MAVPLSIATKLVDVYRNLSVAELNTPEELEVFYEEDVSILRGGDRIAPIQLKLNQERRQGQFFKGLLVGHTGVGKSTEIYRLAQLLGDSVEPIWISATRDLDRGAFKPFDPILLAMVKVAERAQALGLKPPIDSLNRIRAWFDTEKTVVKTSLDTTTTGEIGGEWGKWLGFLSKLKGEIKFASSRSKEVTQYRMERLSDLIDVVNHFLTACNEQLLQLRPGARWMVIGDDFEKPGIPYATTLDLFVHYNSVLRELNAHLLMTVPVALAYSEHQVNLLTRYVIPDTPVFEKDTHAEHKTGRRVLGELLDRRIDAALFEPGQRERVIVASGGNPSDLFRLITEAATYAQIRTKEADDAKIDGPDVERAITDLRVEYRNSLGESPYDPEPVPFAKKAERLCSIYYRDPNHSVPDSTLYSLLRARVVQEFNGERWFGVHPLVVDFLIENKHLPREGDAPVAGGTRTV